MMTEQSNSENSRTEAVGLPPGILGSTLTDACVVMALVAATLLSMYVPALDRSIIQFGLAIVFFMFLPGYAFVAALFPRRNDPGVIERFALSAGMSLVISPLIGFLLNFTIVGIRTLPLTACVAGFTGLCMAVALLRRIMVPAGKRYRVDLLSPLRETWGAIRPGDKNGIEKTATVMVLASLAIAAITVAFVAAVPVQHEKYTELYLYGKNSTISGYPLNFTLGESKPVIVGVANHEGATMAYDLVVALDPGDGTQRSELYSYHIVLGNNETFENAISLSPDRAGDRMNMLFMLYAGGTTGTPYRVCNLWVDVRLPANTMAEVPAP
jgi:uncharacterized membrane protein